METRGNSQLWRKNNGTINHWQFFYFFSWSSYWLNKLQQHSSSSFKFWKIYLKISEIALMEIAPSSSRFKLYDRFELLEFPDKYVVKPIDSPEEGFSVDRRDGNIKPLDGNRFPTLHSQLYPSVLISRQNLARGICFLSRFQCIWYQCFFATAENASSGNPTKVSTIYGVGGTIRLLAGENEEIAFNISLCILVSNSDFYKVISTSCIYRNILARYNVSGGSWEFSRFSDF